MLLKSGPLLLLPLLLQGLLQGPNCFVPAASVDAAVNEGRARAWCGVRLVVYHSLVCTLYGRLAHRKRFLPVSPVSCTAAAFFDEKDRRVFNFFFYPLFV
ncbi:unnamed protein product [Ectocarpus sp. 12 AP-2014]